MNDTLNLYSTFPEAQSPLQRSGGICLNHHQCVAPTWVMHGSHFAHASAELECEIKSNFAPECSAHIG
uniref:Uncharacterized protein n=1 Tax=Anguilla anguilla TaxID=7936 RepID=A0A0E9XTH8_ANGAN